MLENWYINRILTVNTNQLFNIIKIIQLFIKNNISFIFKLLLFVIKFTLKELMFIQVICFFLIWFQLN